MPSRPGGQALRLAQELAEEEEARFHPRRGVGASPSTPGGTAIVRRQRSGAAAAAGASIGASTPTSRSRRPTARQYAPVSDQPALPPSGAASGPRASGSSRTAGASIVNQTQVSTSVDNRGAGRRARIPPRPADLPRAAPTTPTTTSSATPRRPTVAAGRMSLQPTLSSSQNSPARGMTPIDDEALARQLAHEDEALARQLAQQEQVGVRDGDEEMALALAREFEEADARARAQEAEQRNAQMETAIAMAVAAQDFGGIAAAAATAGAAGMSPEAFLGLTGLRELLMVGHDFEARAEPVEQRPAAPSEEQVRRLPTRKASAALLEECPICFATYEEGEELRTLPCLHAFHTECIDQWLTSRRASSLCCPVCHTKVEF